MKLSVRFLAFAVLACFSPWHAIRADDSSKPLQIRHLIIESNTLPARDRRQVVQQFEGHDFPVAEELAERIRIAFRNLGYFRASVDEPQVSFVSSASKKRIAEVRVRVTEGAQYRLGQIEFTGAKAFPVDRLRAVFDQQKGDLFNATKFGEGLEHLRELYGSEGYANVSQVPNPILDESRRVISFTLDIDEGQTCNFGRLILDGPEPHAGAGYALLDAWHALQGKLYSLALLQQWLISNRAYWQDGSRVSNPTTFVADPESPRVLNVRLEFPDDPK